MSFFQKIFGKSKDAKEEIYIAPATFLNPNSTLGELDFHLLAEGRHEKLWEVLGAHVRRDQSGELLGTAFTVWAPNARAVSLISDLNYWDKNTHPMIRLGSSGIWEIFIADIGSGVKYKFAICGIDGRWVDHADPLARQTETPPHTASIVNESNYQWQDSKWIAERSKFEPRAAPNPRSVQ